MVRPRPSWRQDGSPKNGHSRRQGAALGDAHAFSAHAGGGCTVSLLPGWPAHRAPARRLQTDTEDRRRSEREAAVRAGPRPLGTAATRFGDPRLLGRVGASRNRRARVARIPRRPRTGVARIIWPVGRSAVQGGVRKRLRGEVCRSHRRQLHAERPGGRRRECPARRHGYGRGALRSDGQAAPYRGAG